MEGMVAEKNQRYLMVLMRTKICGIDPMKLITPEKDEEEAVDWKNLPPLPFDFSVDLPLGRMFALELDSKIHLVGGIKYMSRFDYYFDHAYYTPCNKVYELDLDKKEVEESQSIDDAPEFSVSGFTSLHKIGSDYYFMRMCGRGGFLPDNDAQNFWVLRSGTKVWEHLPDAPDLPDLPSYHSIIDHSSWFDFYGKLYIRLCFEDGRVVVFSYDTHNPHWTTSEGDNSFTRSFCVPVASDDQRRFFFPRVHIPDLVDPDKYLALSCECIGGKRVIYAFQVDELGVLFFQRLEGCLDRMPSLYDEKTPVLVDLDGKGTFIVMLPGSAKEEQEDPVLFVFVLQVVAKKFVNHPSRVLRRSVRSPTECEFLDWKVLSMHMYIMEVPWGIRGDLYAVFIFPDIQWEEENAQEGTRRGKRNRQI